MERTVLWGGMLLVAASLVGCGSSEATPPTADAAATPAPAGGPETAVHSFLEAVRLGDDTKAQEMLTQLARQKTSEMDMVVAPPGSDTAKFEVGTVEVGTDGIARVDSVWSDLDHEGKRRTDQIKWLLRQESGQWRIAGMATKIFPDQNAVVLNFENPQEMLDKQRQAEEEAARRTTTDEQLQATKPQDPFQAERK